MPRSHSENSYLFQRANFRGFSIGRWVPALLLVFFLLSALALSRFIPESAALTNNGSMNTIGVPLTEDFNTLASTGTGITWTDNSTIPGWYSTRVTYNSGTGSSNAGALYSFGVAGVGPLTDRALGAVASSGTGTVFFGVKLTNNTGSTITSLDVSYIGEQWRTGGSTTATPSVAQTDDFQYQVANPGVITAINTPSTGWVEHDALDFTSPVFGTVTGSALDGNDGPNRISLSSTISVTINPGQEVWLRWRDIDNANNDHGLAIDDFSVTPNAAPPTPTPTPSPTPTPTPSPSPGVVVVSQVYGGGGNSGANFTHDFIELFNRSASAVNLAGWSVQYNSATGTGGWQVTNLSGTIQPGGYYLVQQSAGAGGIQPLPTPDASGGILMAAGAGKVALVSTMTALSGACPASGTIVDQVGYGSTATCFEGSGPTGNLSNTTAALRKRGGCFDSNNNNVDFSVGSPNPRNSASPTNNCTPLALAIHDIQGSGSTTPFLGQFVSTSGIVTGRKTNGFFLQELDANHDLDPATSEGIFVFTSSSPAVAVGDFVSVLGTASEFFNLTQVESTLPGDVTVVTSGNPLPAPITLTTTILNPAGPIDQLERFEGMRMHAGTVVSVAPTNNFGEIFTVLDGVARPFREPGIEISLTVPSDPSSTANVPFWDKNPERIMIDTDGLAGSSAISVTSNVTLSNITGPLDFTFSDYKVLPETPPTTTANMSAIPVPTPMAGEFTVAGYNIENFNNNATQRQKAALAIRDVLHLPDIIGTIEIFDLADLQALAAEIQSISGVSYQAYLIEADGVTEDSDQDVGFLVKSTVQVDSVTQVEMAGCDGTAANCNTFTNPDTSQQELLNDRPPLVLRATINPAELNPLPVIVVVNHTRSFIDIEDLGATGRRVRAKRKAQAEFLANLLQDLQFNNPSTPLMSIGDYNAYQFSDGYTDPVATIKGTPTPDDEIVVDASPDVVTPDFINLTDSLPADQKYTFIFQGTPQAIDHFIINTVANSLVTRYHIARNNTDFPELPTSLFSGNATRPEGNSDHDMPVGYFAIPQAPTTTSVSNATATFNPSDQSVTLTANVSTANGTINEGTVTFTVTNAGNAVVGSPVVGSVSGGVATAIYTLPGGTLPQSLTITGNFSGSLTLGPSSGTGTLSVSYGICLLYDPTKAVKSGATYPIKIQLCDVNGSNVSASSTVVHAVGVGLITTTAYGDVMDAGNANPDNNFRYDSGLGGTGGYIYNLKTTGLSTGTYNLYFTAGSDPVLHAVQFQVK